MELLLAMVGGLTLGCLHAFDVDHVAAVTVFVSKNPNPRHAAALGVRWGMGHTVTVFILGVLSTVLRLIIPPRVQMLAEILVGVLLVTIGVWVLWDVLKHHRVHIHKHMHDGVEHIHFHSHELRSDHRHKHSLFFIGAAHGFAGTASLMVIVPLAVTTSLYIIAAYLVVFGIGTIITMGVLAYFMGKLVASVEERNILSWVQATAGVVSVCVGLLWIGYQLF
jgi:cytochrome c biogenesis protein CcdA